MTPQHVDVTVEYWDYSGQCRAAKALHSGLSDIQYRALHYADLQIVISNCYRLPEEVRKAIGGLSQRQHLSHQ